MASLEGPRAGAPEPRRRREPVSTARRVGSWLVWWVLMMSLWVWADDTLALSELLVGAGVAALAATVTELVQYQAASRVRLRFEWTADLLPIPGRVAKDMVIVFRALWRQLAHGDPPQSCFEETPVETGTDCSEDATWRTFKVWSTSISPNSLALGVEGDRKAMVVHRLVGGRNQQPASSVPSESEGGT